MAPLTLITTHRLAPGAEESVHTLLARYEHRLRKDEPRLLTFQAHLDEAGGRLSLLHVFADPGAADRHLRLVGPLLTEASTLVRNLSIESYGEPGPVLQQAIDRNAGTGVVTVVRPRTVAGFTRAAR
jgi:hypothetical protein